jgi:hypothetical protein
MNRAIDRSAFLNGFVSRPWSQDGLHCWAFVCELERVLFGRSLPLFALMPELREVVRLFRDHSERRNWREVQAPRDGSIVLMSRFADIRRNALHCGVFLLTDGPSQIWHCDDPHGVEAVSPVEASEMRRWSLRYFEPAA